MTRAHKVSAVLNIVLLLFTIVLATSYVDLSKKTSALTPTPVATIAVTPTATSIPVVEKRCLVEMKIPDAPLELYTVAISGSYKVRAPDVEHPSDFKITYMEILEKSLDFQMFRVIVLFTNEAGKSTSNEGWVRVGSVEPRDGHVGQYCGEKGLNWNDKQWYSAGDDKVVCQMAVIAFQSVRLEQVSQTASGEVEVKATSFLPGKGTQYPYYDSVSIKGTNWVVIGEHGEYYVLAEEVLVGPSCSK